MMKRLRLYGLLVAISAACVGLLAACGGPDIALNGTIVDAYTGKPVPAANVKIGSAALTTDAAGKYQVSGWKAEDTLEITASGYEAVKIPLQSQQQLAKPTPPAVTLDAKLRPNTVSGVVTGGYDSKPLAGATVRAGDTLSATTDAGGRYTLANVPPDVTIAVSAPDHDAVQQTLAQQTSFDAALRPNVVTGKITDQYSGAPLAKATITAGAAHATTGADGTFRLEQVPENATVEVAADGYAKLTQSLERAQTLAAALRPDTLKGTLVDAQTGKPLSNATVIATTALNTSDVAFTRLDNSSDGHFTLQGLPEQGYVQVLAPGYSKLTLEIKAGALPDTLKLEPFQAKGLYVKAPIAAYGGMERMLKYFDMIDKTELNTLVLDLKSDNLADLGLIYYQSEVPIIKELGTSKDLMDVRAILAEAKKRHIYTIARIHTFAHDNLLAETKPEWAAHDDRGCKKNENRKCNGPIFYADWDIAWLDQWNENVWDYNIALGVEASHLGFDEINYDYIRFANDGSTKNMTLSKPTDWKNNPQPMYDNIGKFLEKAQRQINGAGAYISADVFGYAAWAPQPNIGQNMAIMSQHTDYICPMVYPSHYNFGELGFEDPATHPFEIIAASLKKGDTLVGTNRARLRPWLQDFTLLWRPPVVRYGVPEVRAQIDASEAFPKGAGWLLWDSDGEFTEGALKPK